mgnify:CR=1 FL=1
MGACVLFCQWGDVSLDQRSGRNHISNRAYPSCPSTQFATINPGTPSIARSASRARSSRFCSLTCGTSRKIGAVTTPLPVLDRDATARPLVFNLPSATNRLGPLQR